MQSVAALCGQSLMLSFRDEGPSATAELLDALVRTRACGVILFAENVRSPAQLHELCSTLQSHAARNDLPPLLIGIDQEGGVVSRLPLSMVTMPSQMAQAASGDPQVAYECARISGQQLLRYGVNLNFAPVLDINCNPANPVIGTRAFGQDPQTVLRFGLAALRGYREAGVIAVAKHFPGHGDTSIDSHLGLPVVHHDLARLEAVELAPFVAAIEAGLPALMTAHIIFSALDDLPATLSPAVLGGLLRGRLGFSGLVFTDALNMQAIADRYGAVEASLMALSAGADVVMPLGSLREQVAVAEALAAAVEQDQLSADGFAATARRLEALRLQYNLTHEVAPYAEPDPSLENGALAAARRGLTLIADQGLLPLARTTRLALIDCTLPRFSLVEQATDLAGLLGEMCREFFPATRGLVLRPECDEAEQALELARASEVVLLVTRNAVLVEQQARLARRLQTLGLPLIHAAVRLPYDAALVPQAGATLLTYGDPPLSLRALLEVLAGVIRAEGTCPVDLPLEHGDPANVAR